MNITITGIDLAKNVFAVHGVDEREKPVLRRTLRREQMMPFFTRLQPCVVAMEACGTAHYWARKLESLGHTVRLMAPQFVKPYVKGNKHDAADAEVICEAACQPGVSVAKLALQHGVNANMLFKWRRQYRAGQFDALPPPATFLPVALQSEPTTVADPMSQCQEPSSACEASSLDGTIEIRFVQAVVRVQGHVDIAVLGTVLSSLNR